MCVHVCVGVCLPLFIKMTEGGHFLCVWHLSALTSVYVAQQR